MDEKNDNSVINLLHRDDRYTCEVGSIVGCRKDPNGTLSLAECSEECTLEKMQLYIPSTITDSFSYSPFKYLASIAGIVKATITIKYPWPASMSEMLLEKDGAMYKEFKEFLKNDNKTAEVIFRIASSSPIDRSFLLYRLLGQITSHVANEEFVFTEINDVSKHEPSDRLILSNAAYEEHKKNMYNYLQKIISDNLYEDFDKYSDEERKQNKTYWAFDYKSFISFREAINSNKQKTLILNITIHKNMEKESAGQQTYGEYHANILIINFEKKSFFYIEPHGKNYVRIELFKHMLLENPNFKDWKFAFSTKALQKNNPYCVTWAIFMSTIISTNPNINENELFNTLIVNDGALHGLFAVFLFYIYKSKWLLLMQIEHKIEEPDLEFKFNFDYYVLKHELTQLIHPEYQKVDYVRLYRNCKEDYEEYREYRYYCNNLEEKHKLLQQSYDEQKDELDKCLAR
jgi:hypothetical protein